MKEHSEGGLAPPENQDEVSMIMQFEPRMTRLADLDFIYVTNVDSSDLSPEIWKKLAEIIANKYEEYDGFVITHGTDTMAFTSSALSLSLQNLGKPVIFTGAQIPGNVIASDARRNLVNAVRLATMDLSGVYLLFSSEIILGARASKVSHYRLTAFRSINAPSAGEISIEIELFSQRKRQLGWDIDYMPGFDPNIGVIELVPGMNVSVLDALLDSQLKGIVLVAYGTGNLPTQYLPFLEKTQKKNLPVVIRTQCIEGATRMQTYASGRQALEFGAIEAYDMSFEATVTKLMWALAREKSPERIKEIMHHNYVGEIRKKKQSFPSP